MAFSFFWTTKPKGKITPLADPDMQTRVQKDGSRASAYVKNGKISESTFPDALTLYDSIRRGARVSNNGPMLGYRKNQLDGTMPYVWSSYKEVIDRSENIAHGFRALGLAAGQKTFIAIYSKNRPEWVIVENASYNHNNVSVPLYDTLGPEASSFILNQTEAKLVVCDVAEKVTEIIKMKPNCPSLKYVVIIEAITSILEEAAKKAGVIALTLDKLEKMGRDSKSKKEHEKPKPEDLATVCYTSGTTGTPKGVMLTHRNIIADCTTLNNFQSVPVRSDDVMMSFLPLAHMFERVVESAVYSVGARVGFFRGDLRLLPDDMKELSPTVLPVVPRLLNRLYDKVMTEISHSLIKKTIFNIAIAVKSRDLNNWVVRNDTFIDNLIFKKIRDGFGGKVRIMLTGSAPLAEDVLTFVRCAMGCVVVEGYGQTECVAAATVTLEGDPIPGHVGIPIPCNIIKLIDVPELDYYVKDNAGEVCVKGARDRKSVV